MKQPVAYPNDVTEARIAELDSKIDVSATRKRTPVLGVGKLESLSLWPGVTLLRADLTGLSPYDAEMQGLAGLVIEIRLKGTSSSKEIDGAGRDSTLTSGDLEIAANPQRTKWAVSAPGQHAFRSIAIGLQEEFLDQMRTYDQGLASLCDNLLAQPDISTSKAPTAMLAKAQALLDTDTSEATGQLRCCSIALELVAMALPNQKPAEHKDIQVSYALDYIKQNHGVDTTIDHVARACRMNTTALKTRFSNAYGISIGAFMRETRLKSARDMLNAGTNLKDAAEILSYKNPDSLSRALRAQT